jgi:SAM-dependent methyltransferase
MMHDELSVGDDHCRVTEPTADDPIELRFEYYRHLFPYAHVAAQLPPDARVLEVGCGAGYGASYLARSVGEVAATDVSEQAVTYARANYPGVRYERAEGTQLPFASAHFDAVVSFQVIEHIERAASYLREIERVLKPGGRAFITTPNRRMRLLPLQRPWNPYHVVEHSDRSLRRLCSSVFGDVELSGVLTKPELMRLERKRVARVRKIALLGPAYQRARRIVPAALLEPLRGRVAPSAQSEAAAPAQGNGADESGTTVSLQDFYLGDDTRGCLDLFVHARKT